MIKYTRKIDVARHRNLSARALSKACKDRLYGYDTDKIDFLRARESDLLFRHGLVYDVSRDLARSQTQVEKALRDIQRQMERERAQEQQRSKQMELSL